MRLRLPWMPRLHPEARNKDGSVKREPLSYFYNQLSEQIGFFILRDVRGLDNREVKDYARTIKLGTAVWPLPEDGKVRLGSSTGLPHVNSLIARMLLMATVPEAQSSTSFVKLERPRSSMFCSLLILTACSSPVALAGSEYSVRDTRA